MSDDNKDEVVDALSNQGKTKMVDGVVTREYTSSRGYKARFKPASLLFREKMRQNMMKKEPYPEPPTYEAESFGEVIQIEHTSDSIVGNEEDEKAWQNYLDECRDWDGRFNSKWNKYCRIDCMEIIGLTEEDMQAWRDKMAFAGVELAEPGSLEERSEFIEYEWSGGVVDIVSISRIPLDLAVQDSEVSRVANNLFRLAVEENRREAEQSADEGAEVGAE